MPCSNTSSPFSGAENASCLCIRLILFGGGRNVLPSARSGCLKRSITVQFTLISRRDCRPSGGLPRGSASEPFRPMPVGIYGLVDFMPDMQMMQMGGKDALEKRGNGRAHSILVRSEDDP